MFTKPVALKYEYIYLYLFSNTVKQKNSAKKKNSFTC